MQLHQFDLFQSPFTFKYANIGKSRQRSTVGLILSIVIYGIATIFFVYLLMLYFENKINPTFQTQIFFSDQGNTLELDNNFFGFRFLAHPNSPQSSLQKDQSKTYITFLPSMLVKTSSGSKLINLEIIQCDDSLLSGFQCINFSTIRKLEINSIDSSEISVQIRAYKCFEIDGMKQEIPNNCVISDEIDGLFDNNNAPLIQMKMYTQQYNTTSLGMQTNYKNMPFKIQKNKQIQSTISSMKQIVSVKRGSFLQQETEYDKPIDYSIEDISYNYLSSTSNIDKSIGLIEIKLDGKVQYTSIKFATFFEIIAIWNSLIIFFVGIVVIGRFFANKLMLEDISLVFLRNIYQNTYLNQLDLNQIFRKRQIRCARPQLTEDLTEKKEIINIPSIVTKNRKQLDPCSCQSKNIQDSVLEMCDTRRASLLGQTLMNQQTVEGQKKEVFDLTLNGIGSPAKEPILTNILQDQILTLSESAYLPNPIPKTVKDQSITTLWKREIKQAKNNPLSPFKLTHSIKLKENTLQPQQTLINNIPSNKTLQQSIGLKTQNKLDSKVDQLQEQTNPQGISQFCILKLDNTESCAENMYAIQNNNFSTQLKSVIFKMWKNDKQKKDNLKERERTQNILREQVSKNLDILQIYKDLIILKKAIMLLLSKEQYAALLLTGCSINQKDINAAPHSVTDYNIRNTNEVYTQRTVPQEAPFVSIKGKSTQQIMYESQHIKMMENYKGQSIFGHLDEQFQIQDSEKWQIEYLKQFLQRCKDSQNLTEIDKRILSSLTL